MGLLFGKCWPACCCGCCCCFRYHCCCPCCTRQPQPNIASSSKSANNSSVVVLPEKRYKVLLLGGANSGKTHVGHQLSQMTRVDYEPTNGVQCYRMRLPAAGGAAQLNITEIGGNAEMQKIWHHYYATTMGLLYCFDLSASYAQLRASFTLLRQTLAHRFMRGKPVLLIATKADLVDEGVQLYDIENTFQLEALARHYACSIRLCCADADTAPNSNSSLQLGVIWLSKYLQHNQAALQVRIACDENEQNWQKQMQKLMLEGKLRRRKYQRFPQCMRNKFVRWSSRRVGDRWIRPKTAPAGIYCLPASSTETILTEADVVVASIEYTENSTEVPNITSHSNIVTEV